MKRMKWQTTEMFAMNISNKRLKAKIQKNSYKTMKRYPRDLKGQFSKDGH